MPGRTRQSAAAGAGARGFTLVELLVVVAILALLLALLMPSLGRVRELARRAMCQANLHAMGRAWSLYLHASNDKPGSLFHPYDESKWGDTLSQWNGMIFKAHWAIGDGGYYVNTGRLWQAELLQSKEVFVCPTMARPSGGWFNSPTYTRFRCPRAWNATLTNYWPPRPGKTAYTCYARRRNYYYDEPALSAVHGAEKSDDHIQLLYTGVGIVERPTNFSWMADSFVTPEAALDGHVPGVNVLYLDGHVEFFTDEEGEVLYDNGLPDWVWKVSGPGAEYNWLHDDIWMIIDGYHKPPVGQGR